MNPALDSLIGYALKHAYKRLQAEREVPLFAAIVDEGVPSYLNIHLEEGYDAPKSVGGLVELMRLAIRESGTPAALYCVPVRVPADDGTEWDAVQFHVDHIDDTHAYVFVIRYAIDARGKVHLDTPVSETTDDRILARP